MDKTITYLALILALISLAIGMFLLVQFHGTEALTERLDVMGSQAATRQVEVQKEENRVERNQGWQWKYAQTKR